MIKMYRLVATDFKVIFRDPSLRTFLFLPVILFLLMIWWVPALISTYEWLEVYTPLFLVIAIIENTQMFCAISSMVLIDEKESDIAKVYGVVPLSKLEFLTSRFLFPFVFTFGLNFILIFAQPFYQIHWANNIIISSLAALVVPVYVLGINCFVKNRMQGMVYIKAFNILVLIPFAAFFVPEHFKHFFGIFPTHWLFQSIVNVTNNLPFTAYSVIGFAMMISVLLVVARMFLSRHFT